MKVLCLKGEYSIKNISSLLDNVKSGAYDSVDYSASLVDDYVKFFLDLYNEQVKIPTRASFYSSGFFINEVRYLLNSIKFSKIILKRCSLNFQNQYFYTNVIADLYTLGTESFLVVAALSFFFGINVAYQSYLYLSEMGVADNGMEILILSAFKQSGVLISFIVFLTKYSSGIISKVGFMKVSEEWTALRIMKIDPEIFLLKTKIYSLAILVPFFAYVSIFFTCLSGFLVFKIFYGTTLLFVKSTSSAIRVKIFFIPLLKGVFMGAVLGVISAYEAYLVEKSSDNILSALNHGVIMSLTVGFLVDIALDLVLGL